MIIFYFQKKKCLIKILDAYIDEKIYALEFFLKEILYHSKINYIFDLLFRCFFCYLKKNKGKKKHHKFYGILAIQYQILFRKKLK